MALTNLLFHSVGVNGLLIYINIQQLWNSDQIGVHDFKIKETKDVDTILICVLEPSDLKFLVVGTFSSGFRNPGYQ